MFPYHVERKVFHSQKDRYVPVPCGKCPECLKRRSASWAFRLEKEAERHDTQYFITLTYNARHIPLTGNKFMSLRKRDLQLYFKRLRNFNVPFKYYAVGEYGTNNKRPHYHFILFTSSDLTPNNVMDAWLNPVSKQLMGHVHFGKVESGSIRYTIQYYDKGEWKPVHARDDREREFSIMSKGLGSNFLTPQMVDHLIKNPDIQYLYGNDNTKLSIPRFYKKRIFQYQGTQKMVEAHPSFLVARDELAEVYKVRIATAAAILDKQPVIEDSAQRQDARRAAIENFRKSKRKMRD